ncbi:hypothetical protein GCM10009676_42670 [Prauserella halophila]|uniref:DUF3093 domain-containing protein n=1 Tax=Prauserella halophila TaxID=185641 RepID=A0ABP4H9B9_9PSEU|nr:hypothetical protein [Prauserella halophila]MCP2237860.1 hypothetical protein [Prauserella halophila]
MSDEDTADDGTADDRTRHDTADDGTAGHGTAGSEDTVHGTAGGGTAGGEDTVHYDEPGSGLWRLGLGPALAALGFVTEVLLGQPPHWLMWIITGVGLLWLNGAWVFARRKFLRVRVTDTELVQGTETVPIADIASVLTREPRPGTRVLGGGQTVPNRFEAVELTLVGRKHVLAWSQDSETFTAALHTAMRNSRRD